MRILHVDTGPDLRGGQRQLLMLLQGLKRQGHEQVLLARGELLERWPGTRIGATALWRKSRSVDLVHAHSGRAHTLAALFCRGKPIVVSRRVAFPVGRGLLSSWKYKRARKFLAVSEHVRAVLLQAGIPEEKVCVVYDAVEQAELEHGEAISSRVAPGKPLRVLTPCIDDTLKRSDLVEKACEKVGAELTLSSDLKRDIAKADVFVYLSESEGLGSAALLAMAHKKPVVASRVGGLPELVIDQQTGLLVENDIEQVAAAIDRITRDAQLAQRCVDKAFERVSEQFTDAIMVRRTEQIYQALVRESTASE